MNDKVTLGYMLQNGEEVDLGVGVHDWKAQSSLVDDCLFALHQKLEGESARTVLPSEEILAVRYIVQNMKDNLIKMEQKIDQLIEESMEEE
jgi:hypothetical protein